jgi:phosphotransferase system  glucose/maltose/N-acetylglucosamine-specific IIC component
VELDLTHDNYFSTYWSENLVIKNVLYRVWQGALEGTTIPGASQIGELPFTYGAAIGIFFSIVVGLTFGKRHAGLAILTIALFLVVLGPIMGAFTVPEIVIPMIATIGILVMLIPKR